MTDKQIIIDGVDVSGCENLMQGIVPFGCMEDRKTCSCMNNPNCLYKQLKRKEQECERLKGKNNYSPEVLKQCPHYKNDNVCTYLGYETKCEGDCNYTAFQDFIAEIDDLKNVNSNLQEQLDQLKFDYAELEKRHNDSFEQFKQLKAENDELKKQRQADKGLITATGKMNYELIQEYDKLKAENEKYSLFIEKLLDYAGLECDSEEQAMRTLSDLASQMNKARWIIDRYKQTLTEIKEIAEDWIYTEVADELATLILQKISEVEDANI